MGNSLLAVRGINHKYIVVVESKNGDSFEDVEKIIKIESGLSDLYNEERQVLLRVGTDCEIFLLQKMKRN